MPPRSYTARLVDTLLGELMAEFPAVLVVGPRGTGKTTTARRHARSVLQLDRPAQAGAVSADPDVVLAAADQPVLVDEWQLVPEVMGAVKRAVDADPAPGRFVLTGSVRAEFSPAGWPATGRVLRVPLWGLCERELTGATAGASLVDVLFAGALDRVVLPDERPDLRGYVDVALRGMFPEVALESSANKRERWLSGYVQQLVRRDAELAGEVRDAQRLARYLRALAVNSAGVVEHKTLYDAAGITRPTAVAYDNLLESLFVTAQLPAWHTNRLTRVTRAPKRYLVDPGLYGPLAGFDARGVLRDVDQLGRLIDTFVVSQLRPELDTARQRATMFHLRQAHGGREVDVVLEAPDGRVVGIEIKAAAAPGPDAPRHLLWMRDQLGDTFVAGVLFHTGPLPYRIGDRVHALPICALWGTQQPEIGRAP